MRCCILSDHFYSCASSKHLQTRRFLDTIGQYLEDVRRLVTLIYRQANERPEAFVDHTGTLIDSRTGSALVVDQDEDEDDEGGDAADGADGEDPSALTAGYSFYDAVSDVLNNPLCIDEEV